MVPRLGLRYALKQAMHHTFFQKLILTVLAGALTAGAYELVYKGLILGAEQSINGGYKVPTPMHHPKTK